MVKEASLVTSIVVLAAGKIKCEEWWHLVMIVCGRYIAGSSALHGV